MKSASLNISNPKSSRELEANDSLLCYGKIEKMKSMIPNRPKRRKKLSPLPVTPVTEGSNLDENSAASAWQAAMASARITV